MECPKGVDIPEIFSIYSQYRVFGNAKKFVNGYQWAMDNHFGGENCVKCYACAKKCPQQIDIPAQLARIHDLFLEEKAKLEAEEAAAK